MHLHFTSGYHPEGDGQTECTNQTLEQYICVYCNYQQDNWDSLLPLAEFAYNNAPSATTGISPFFANKGYHPNITVHPKRDFTSIRPRKFAVDLDELHSALKDHIRKAQSQYQVSADCTRSLHPKFPIGSSAFVKAQFFCTTRPAKKFAEKYLSPFGIIGRAGMHSVILRLPDSMQAVHPVFHISMLEPSLLNTIPNRIQPPPAPIVIDGEPEYEISEILDTKINHCRRLCNLLYLVHWSGYKGTDDETAWVLATELSNASEVVTEFHSQYPSKPGPWPL